MRRLLWKWLIDAYERSAEHGAGQARTSSRRGQRTIGSENHGTRAKLGATAIRSADSARTACVSMLCTRSATSRTTEALGRSAGVSTRCCAASPSSVISSANKRSQCAPSHDGRARGDGARNVHAPAHWGYEAHPPPPRKQRAFSALAARRGASTLAPWPAKYRAGCC